MPSHIHRGTLASIARVVTLGYSETKAGKLRLRRGAACAVRTFLHARSRSLPLADLKSVLVVAPHPDDETLGCGGTVSLLARAGATVTIAFLTDGGASHPDHPAITPRELADRRRKEARAAAGELGVDEGHLIFLGAPDGALGRLDRAQGSDIAGALAAVITRAAPQAMLLPPRRDGSSDHDAAFDLALRARSLAGTVPRMLEFPVWSMWNPTLLLAPALGCRRVWRVALGGALEAKARAIARYPSQTLPIPPDTSPVLPPGFVAMFATGAEYFFEA